MKRFSSKKVLVFLSAAALTLMMTATAFAAWKLLSPKEVALNLGNQTLAQAFDSEDATKLNKKVVSGGYEITLLGLVSGKELSDFESSQSNIYPERTYAVVSIAKEDGTPMPASQDTGYGETPFFVSPLIKGQKPWLYNIASMGGEYSEIVNEGIMYRLIACDNVEIFADRGLYLCVSTSPFYDTNAFNYDEQTGAITPNTGYSGANALFDLPLDVTKANYEEGQRYLDSLYQEDNTEDNTEEKSNTDLTEKKDLEALMEKAERIEASVKEVTYEKDGIITYEYGEDKISLEVEVLFTEGQTGLSEFTRITEDENITKVIRFEKDNQGVIRGMVFQISKK